MIDTSKLIELEEYVGHDAKSRVISGPGGGVLTVQVWITINDIPFARQQSFHPACGKEFLDKFEMFKGTIKRHFDALVDSKDLNNFKRI